MTSSGRRTSSGRTDERIGSSGPNAVVVAAAPGSRFQFERIGYFCVDKDSTPNHPVFNRTVTFKDSWAKIEKGQVA